MAVIELSPGFAAAVPARVMRLGNNDRDWINRSNSGLLMGDQYASGYYTYTLTQILFMKGTVPTGWITWADRSADLLCRFKVGTTGIHTFGKHIAAATGTVVGTTTTVNSLYAPALATGTCTWFLWHVYRATTDADVPTTQWHQLIGTVGLPGSGADLEIPDVDLVTGGLYKITNLPITFPSSWTV